MNDFPEALDQALELLAVRFGGTAEQVWSILIRQVYVNFSVTVAVTVFAAAFLTFAYPRAKIEVCTMGEGSGPLWFILTGLCIMTLIGCFVGLIHTGIDVLNPEYYAIRKIMEALR